MTKLNRFTLTFPKDLETKVEEYRESNSISTRSKAIHELVRAGLASLKANDEQESVSNDAKDIVAAYQDLGTAAEKNMIRRALNLGVIEEPKTAQTKIIPLLSTAAAAGPSEMDTGLPWEQYTIPADSKADFAVRISGDSMEPVLTDGQIALCAEKTPQIGDVAVMMVNGALLVKQFIGDGHNIYLRSINRDRKDADVDIWESGNERIECYGIVILKKRPALVTEY